MKPNKINENGYEIIFFFALTGISYMNAKCEVTVGDSFVVVKILHGQEKVRVFINDVEQNATENTCKCHHEGIFFVLNFFFIYFGLIFAISFQSPSDTTKSL